MRGQSVRGSCSWSSTDAEIWGERGVYTLDGSGGFRANKTTACGPKGARGLKAKSA